MDYNAAAMTEVRQTPEFSTWLHRLRDANAVARIRRMKKGNPGDSKSVGGSILEMRIDHGPGYRIHYVHRGAQIVILLCGGDKRRQQQDIKRAQTLAETI
jgi:putative addiction module killer protein